MESAQQRLNRRFEVRAKKSANMKKISWRCFVARGKAVEHDGHFTIFTPE